jgi:cytidylate kinase
VPTPLTITIDGYSACGKSTLARALAQRLGYRYIDTGAMYRAVTLHLHRLGVDIGDEGAVAGAIQNLDIQFRQQDNHLLLNGQDVEHDIRGLEISNLVSPVAAIPAVRRLLVEQQRRMGQTGGVVLDGRDIGTVVFPDADLKLFVVADLDTRTERRVAELTQQGRSVDRSAVADNLRERDHIDSTRQDSPLRRADDAILLDNSTLTLDELVDRGEELVAAIRK